MYLDNRKKTCHLVMDYDNSPSLLKYTDLNEYEIRSIMQQLVSILAYIHTQNICQNVIYHFSWPFIASLIHSLNLNAYN